MVDLTSLQWRFTPTLASPPLLPQTSNAAFFKLHSPKFHCRFPCFALKKSGKGAPAVALGHRSDSDVEFDEDDFEAEEEEEEDEMVLPLRSTREWRAARPRGFGEGTEYDTSIEDQLLRQVEHAKAAQPANINKLKNLSISGSKSANIKAPEIVSTGVRVRIVNLPKKKNIHRDLMVAFKAFPGIINITPAVVGSKKTRDPICKGFAFVDCKSEGDAISFVQAFSGQYLMFGRVQKQIKCEIMNQQTSSCAHISVVSTQHSRLNILEEEAEQVADMNLVLAGEVIRTTVDDIEENIASISETRDEGGNGAESRSESNIPSPTQKELVKIHKVEVFPQGREEVCREISPIKGKRKVSKKKVSKEKGEKNIGLPGSAKRLRIKEKAVLTDVYSRYGKKTALVSKEEN